MGIGLGTIQILQMCFQFSWKMVFWKQMLWTFCLYCCQLLSPFPYKYVIFHFFKVKNTGLTLVCKMFLYYPVTWGRGNWEYTTLRHFVLWERATVRLHNCFGICIQYFKMHFYVCLFLLVFKWISYHFLWRSFLKMTTVKVLYYGTCSGIFS